MTDVLLIQTNDDGDVVYQDGDLLMDGGIRTAVYLSLFGGNRDDGGFDDTTHTWWANLAEVDPALKYRSELQFILKDIPLIPANLLRIEDAAKRDLEWLVTAGHVTGADASASIPKVDTLQLTIFVDELELIFVEHING